MNYQSYETLESVCNITLCFKKNGVDILHIKLCGQYFIVTLKNGVRYKINKDLSLVSLVDEINELVTYFEAGNDFVVSQAESVARYSPLEADSFFFRRSLIKRNLHNVFKIVGIDSETRWSYYLLYIESKDLHVFLDAIESNKNFNSKPLNIEKYAMVLGSCYEISQARNLDKK